MLYLCRMILLGSNVLKLNFPEECYRDARCHPAHSRLTARSLLLQLFTFVIGQCFTTMLCSLKVIIPSENPKTL